jgi:hypothetical protein
LRRFDKLKALSWPKGGWTQILFWLDACSRRLSELSSMQRCSRLAMSRRIGGFGIYTGPASLMLIDPDGNPVLIDQHIACPP